MNSPFKPVSLRMWLSAVNGQRPGAKSRNDAGDGARAPQPARSPRPLNPAFQDMVEPDRDISVLANKKDY
jgi:hypothetical protein